MRIMFLPFIFIIDLCILIIAHLITLIMWDKIYAAHYWGNGDLFIDLFFKSREIKKNEKIIL